VVGTLGKLACIARYYQRFFGIRTREYLKAMEFHAYATPDGNHRVDVYPTGGRDRNEDPLFYLVDSGMDAVMTQARALLRAARLYHVANVEGRRILSVTVPGSIYDSDSLELTVISSLLVGVNCIPCRILPEIYVPYARPRPSPATKFVLDLHREVCDMIGQPDYYELVRQDVPKPYAWLSVGKTQGLISNLSNMIRTRSDVSVSPKDLSIAVLRNLYRHGYRPDTEKVPIEEPSRENLHGMHVSWQASGGVVLSQPTTMKTPNGNAVHTGPRGTKAEHFGTEVQRLVELIMKIVEKDYDYKSINFPILPNSLSEKVELRYGKEDPEKVRVIFMVCLLKVMIDRIVHGPFIKFTRFRGSNGIGTKWGAGDAQRFASMFHANDKSRKRVYVDGDVRKLDQSLKAKIIIIFCLLSLLAFDEADPLYRLMEVLVAFSAETTSRKFVRWVDGLYRYLMTCLFSGEYITSPVDTFDVDLIFETYSLRVYHEIKRVNPELAKKFWHDLAIGEIVWNIYGDDFVYTIPAEYESWFNLDTLNSFMKVYWDTELKLDACHSSDSFYTSVCDDVIVKLGPIFLKFYFVEMLLFGKITCVVWKPAEALIIKAGLATSPITSPLDQLSRIHGLMISSAGTNTKVWTFLSCYSRLLISRYHDAYSLSRGAEKEYSEKLKLVGVPSFAFPDPLSEPNRDALLRLLMPGSAEYDRRTGDRKYRSMPTMRMTSYK